MYKSGPVQQFVACLTIVAMLLGYAPGALAQSAAGGATKTSGSATTAAKPTTTTTAAPAPAASGEASTTSAPAGDAAPAGPTAEQREAARAAFEAGMKAYEAGEFLVAAGEFKKASEAIPSPHAEYWIALSLDKADPEQKNPRATADAYELFVTNPAAKHVGEEQLATSVERVKQLRLLLPGELVVITTPAGATVKLNGEPLPGTTPITIERPAGKYTLEASAEGHSPLTIEVTLEGGITLEQQMNLAPLPPPPPPVVAAKEEEKKERSKVPLYVTLGIAGAALVTGTVFGIMALDAKSQYDSNPTADKADEVERNALIADMSLGVAITLGITGIVLMTAKDGDAATGRAPRGATAQAPAPRGKPASRTELVVAPYGGPTGGGGVARLTF